AAFACGGSEHQFLFSRKQRYRDYTGGVGNYNTPYYATNNPYSMTFPTVKEERQGWDMVERQFIVNVLTGPLYWLGMIELGYRKGESPGEGVEPAGYRLTQVGAWLLGLAEPPEFIESGGRVLVQPSFTVIAMEPVSDTVLLALDEFADPQGGDRAVTYHLTRQSVYRAQRRGWDAARIRSFLEQHQGGNIPANVQRSLDEWQVLHQRITFHRAAPVLQYADETARAGVRETLAKTGVALDSLSPNFDLLRADLDGGQEAPSLAGVTDALSEAGWMPLVTPRHADAQTEGSLRIDEAGEIIFKQAVPNIYALSQLAPVTEGSDGRRRITAQCVRAAMSGGMTLDELLTILAHLHDGPLPQKVETSIRAWAGFYGEASLKSIHLLELTSLEVLNNLLQDEQVSQFLKPIEGSTVPLALVEADNVAQVRAVLVERGVNVRPGT
ncbi:MAG: helicase-associated domain-containing protein, partial [Chloroflexi bacterium]|nr:helicase-associated domain-containing protein [Chloroflexota bacterium]